LSDFADSHLFDKPTAVDFDQWVEPDHGVELPWLK